MINFKEELLKYHPILEIDNIENAIHSSETKDMLDILTHISKIRTAETNDTKNDDI